MVGDATFRSLLESAPDAIVIVDPSGRIVIVNRQAERLFGYSRDELVGQPVELLVPQALREAHEAHRRGYMERPATRPMGIGLELSARRRDGSEVPVEISLSPLETADGLLVTSIIRDISERKALEEERRRLLAERETQAERQRIAMDLHDGVIQSIYAVGLGLEMAALEVEDDPAQARRRIEQAIDELNQTIQDIRDYIFRLQPARYSGDLAGSLERLLHDFATSAALRVSVDVDPEAPPLDDDIGAAVFHVAQEALSNIRKHANASSVRAELRRRGDRLTLVIRDDGVGFDPDAPRSEAHRGLRNMRARVASFGGDVRIESAPGHGAAVIVEVPIRRAQPAEASAH
ncbi:MAG TPA: PAS domain S-box protein [Dehalococcoidia bacterium]|nr:PAS domain S-box protein [Dehalococcoidia bacterium]